MDGLWPQLVLVVVLIVVNAIFAGSELALVSLRESQVQQLAKRGRSGAALAKLVADPNRYLSTIQIFITLAGFFASASAAVAMSGPLAQRLTFLGEAARPVALVLVTLIISYVTLVIGELAPKRLAMQRAESWALLVAQPLSFLARVSKPLVWLLSKSADVVVRLLGGDPDVRGEEVTDEELRALVASQGSMSHEQRLIISGAFDISERTLREIVRPRREVFVIDDDLDAEEALAALLASGYSRAPVATNGDLDHVHGVVHLRDLIGKSGKVGSLASPPLVFPETLGALEALKEMQRTHQHMAIVISEHGTGEGIVTIEDLLEEVVGEIYDESDRDVLMVEHGPDGSLILPGSFPVHDLVDLGVHLPEGEYTTIAGLILDHLGRVPDAPGDEIVIGSWTITVLEVADRAIRKVRLVRQTRSRHGSNA